MGNTNPNSKDKLTVHSEQRQISEHITTTTALGEVLDHSDKSLIQKEPARVLNTTIRNINRTNNNVLAGNNGMKAKTKGPAANNNDTETCTSSKQVIKKKNTNTKPEASITSSKDKFTIHSEQQKNSEHITTTTALGKVLDHSVKVVLVKECGAQNDNNKENDEIDDGLVGRLGASCSIVITNSTSMVTEGSTVKMNKKNNNVINEAPAGIIILRSRKENTKDNGMELLSSAAKLKKTVDEDKMERKGDNTRTSISSEMHKQEEREKVMKNKEEVSNNEPSTKYSKYDSNKQKEMFIIRALENAKKEV